MESIQDAHQHRLNQLMENDKIRGGSGSLTEHVIKQDENKNKIITTFSRTGSTGAWKLISKKEKTKILHQLFPPNRTSPSSTTYDEIKANHRMAGGII